MSGYFDSGSVNSQVLFPENIAGNGIYQGVPLPHNYGKFSQSAQDLYFAAYQQAQLIGCLPNKCHTSAMEIIKKTHILREGKWILPDPNWH